MSCEKPHEAAFNVGYILVCTVAVAVVLLDVFYWRP